MSEFVVHSFTQTCLISGRATALVLARGHDISTGVLKKLIIRKIDRILYVAFKVSMH